MADGIYTALSGALAQQHSLDVIANNVANASTTGFRGDRVVFGEMLAGAQRSSARVDPRQPPPPTTDKFVRVEMNQLDGSAGALRATGNPLDLGLNSDGYFLIKGAQGERLTRAGNFMLREDGAVVTPDGSSLLDEAGNAIVLPQRVKDIEVKPNGMLRVDGHDFAKIAVRSVEPSQLVREGTTTYTVAQGAALGTPARVEIAQGHLEMSNVNAVSGLNELISVSRSFDALHRVIETFQQIDQRTARDVGSRSG